MNLKDSGIQKDPGDSAVTPQIAQPGFGTQPCYKAPNDLWAKYVSNPVIYIGLVRLPPTQWPKVDHGAAKSQINKYRIYNLKILKGIVNEENNNKYLILR